MRKKKLKLQVSLPRNERNIELVQDIEKAAKFFLDKLISKRLQNTLSIKIHVRKTTLGADVNGVHFSDANGCDRQREHKIVLRDNDWNMFETLAHELVHVQQSASKRLQYRYWKSDHQLHVRWEGKELGKKNLIPYRQRPWEVEAFDLAAKLHSEYHKKWKKEAIDQMFQAELRKQQSA
jgi:hypothetical protein